MKLSLKSILFTAALATLAAGCGETSQALLSKLPHHDHSSRRGGPVLMNGDTHFEIALARNGEHALLFSDAFRKPISASRIAEASITVMRQGEAPERLELDAASGEEGAWVAYGRPIDQDSVEVRVTYRAEAEPPYTIDVPVTLGAAAPHAHSH